MKKIKAAYILLTVLLSLWFIILGGFAFRNSYLRFIETVKDLRTSVIFYCSKVFFLSVEAEPTVNGYSDAFAWSGYLPDSLNEIKRFISVFFTEFVSKENFTTWLDGVVAGLGIAAEIVILVLPAVIITVILFKRAYRKPNNDYARDTVQLKVFKKTVGIALLPVYNFIRGYTDFLKGKRWIKILWILLWGFNLNIAGIVVAFFAYYFYFTVSFDVGSIFIQLAKLVIDLQVAVKTIPVVVWVWLAVYLWDRWRRKIANKRLRHFEARNCGFIKELSIASLSCGSMGKKKTTLITDMVLSQAVMFRQEAFKRLQKTDMKFPYFPWIRFEKELRACM